MHLKGTTLVADRVRHTFCEFWIARRHGWRQNRSSLAKMALLIHPWYCFFSPP